MSPSADHTSPAIHSLPIVRLGTRSSQLALWQSRWVKSRLEKSGYSIELIKIDTDGDLHSGPLAQIGGQGVFTKRIQTALVENRIDLAVHSLKDLPTDNHPGLVIAAIPPRENPLDALVSCRFADVASLPLGATIGTGSVRRAAELLHLRPDLTIKDIRGNVDTRLKKLDAGHYDAIILACAGLIRLGQQARISYQFTPAQMMPAVGQGALGLESRSDDPTSIAVAQKLNDPSSFHGAMAERAMLQALFAGCLTPIGAFTQLNGDDLTLSGVVLSRDGKQRIQARETRPLLQADSLGHSVAQSLIDQGAHDLLKN